MGQQTSKDHSPARPPFDLEESAARFGEAVIRFCKGLPGLTIVDALVRQLIRSATSIGANYCEAVDAVSKKEFKCKIGICKREAREPKHWLRMIAAADESAKEDSRRLWQEAKELHLIFAAIYRR